MSIIDKKHAIERLEAAIAGLSGLTAESLKYDSELLEQCVGMVLLLQNTLNRFNGAEMQEPEGNIETRSLIAAVTLRSCSLLAEIERERKLGQVIIDSHEEKLNELKWQGYREEEALKLAPPPTEQINAYRLSVIDLEARRATLEAFLSNPDNVSVLAGTEFDNAALVATHH